MLKGFSLSQCINTIKKVIEQVKADNLENNDPKNQAKLRLIRPGKSIDQARVQVIGTMRAFDIPFKQIITHGLLIAFSPDDATKIERCAIKPEAIFTPSDQASYQFKRVITSLTGELSKIEIENELGELEQWPCVEALTNTDLLNNASDQQKVEVGYIAGIEESRKKWEDA